MCHRSCALQVKTKIEDFLKSAAGQRFLKLAGMLSSSFEGERANASAMANDLLREAGLTWGEVLGAGPAPSQGGQLHRIVDLEARLKIARRDYEDARAANARLYAKVAKLENDLLEAKRRETERQRDYSRGNDPAPKDRPNPKPRTYASELQRGLNRAVDQIEAAVELNEWEQQFCASLRDLKYKLSPKQAARLNALLEQANIDEEFEAVG
jgi:chromosome segregation ATPase